MENKDYEVCFKRPSRFKPEVITRWTGCKKVSLDDALKEIRTCFSTENGTREVTLQKAIKNKKTLTMRFTYTVPVTPLVNVKQEGYGDMLIRIKSLRESIPKLADYAELIYCKASWLRRQGIREYT